ncbi:MAG: phage head closure protein [Pirellulaceae bacterium]
MRAGRLNKRITLQQPVTTTDSFGGETTTWQDVASRWAGIEPLRGKEYFEAQAAQSQIELRIVIRYDSALASLDPTWRVQYGARVMEIESVINTGERNEQFELMCREQTT